MKNCIIIIAVVVVVVVAAAAAAAAAAVAVYHHHLNIAMGRIKLSLGLLPAPGAVVLLMLIITFLIDFAKVCINDLSRSELQWKSREHSNIKLHHHSCS
jgi:uncharacterized membrane protein YciS (DUF1049 family)